MPNVHVVDDNFIVRESIGFILHDADYSVRQYGSTEEFLRGVTSDESGCVIADLHLPGKSGLDLLDGIEQLDIALPTIMVTGDSSLENVVMAMRRGAIDFIFKPFSAATLLAAVGSALEQTSRRPADDAEAAFCRQSRAALAPGEEAVLAGVLGGRSIETIASDLGLVANDVWARHANVMTKMGARNLPDLVRKSRLGAGASLPGRQ